MYRRRRWVMAVAGLFLAFAGVWGTQVFGSLASGGFDDSHSDSYRAGQVAAAQLGRDDSDVIVLYRSATQTVDAPGYQRAVTGTLGAVPPGTVDQVTTYWSAHAPALVSTDRHATYAVLRLTGADDTARRDRLAPIPGRPPAPRRSRPTRGAPPGHPRHTTARANRNLAG